MQKNYFKSLTIGFFLTMSLCVDSFAQNVPLSIDDALAIFYQQNLDLLAAQYNIEQSKADEIVAAAIPNPTFGFQLSEIAKNPNMGASAIGCNHDANVSCGLAQNYSFSQLIETAGKRGLRMQSSGFATQAAESDFKDAVRIFSNMVTESYFGLLQAQKNRWLAQEIVDNYRDILKANHLRLKEGDISESNFLRVKMEAMHAQSDLDNAQMAVEQAQAGLAVLLRWPDKSLQFEAKDEWENIKDIGQTLSKETLIDKALQQRPDLQADKLRAEQANKALELAQRLKYPDVTVNAGYAHDPSNNNLSSAFVGFSVPLPLFYQYQGETDKAFVNLNQNKLAIEQTEISIRNEVIVALAAWHNANKVVQRFNEGLLKDALTVKNSSELAYSKGATSVLDFIDAQRNYKNVMRDYYGAMINRVNAYYNLAKSLGMELKTNKSAVANDYNSYKK